MSNPRSVALFGLVLLLAGCKAPESHLPPWMSRTIESPRPSEAKMKPGYCTCDNGASRCMNDNHKIEVTADTCGVVILPSEANR